MNPEIAISMNEQVRDYVFCKDCEDRFNKNGEAWVLENCYRDGGGFALKDILDATEPDYNDGNLLKVYSSTKLTRIDFPKLVYFAASVFWKSSVHRWHSGKHKLASPTLGPKYEEQFRQFLLGEEEFPKKATLWLNIISDNQLWNYFNFPYGGKENGYRQTNFQFFGFAFTLFLGDLVPSNIRRFCFAQSTECYIAMSKVVDDMVLTHAGKLIVKTKPVGSLRKEFAISKGS